MLPGSGRVAGEHGAAHSRAAGRRRAVAQLRGAVAGALSACLAFAAHGWAAARDGAELTAPGSTAVVLLLAAAAVTGAAVAAAPGLRDNTAGLVTTLGAAQLLGHLGLGFDSGHLHHGDAQLTPGMLAAHAVAVFLAAALVRGTGAAHRIALAALARAVPRPLPAPPVADRTALPVAHRDRVVLRIFAARGLRTRAPPVSFAY